MFLGKILVFIKKNSLYILPVSLIALMLLAYFSPKVSVYLLFVSNIFFFGNSDAKLFGSLFYLFVLVVYAIFAKKGYKVKIRIKSLYVWLSIFIVAIMNLTSFFALVIRFNLDIAKFPIFISNGNYESISHLLHTHTFKTAITWFFTLFNIDNLNHYGDGILFFNYMPLFYILGFVSLMVMATVVFLKVIEIINVKKPSIFFIVLYVLLTFGIFKNSVDGGPLNNEYIISMVFYYLLLNYEKFIGNEEALIKRSFVALLLLTTFYTAYYCVFIGNKSVENIYNLFTPIYSVYFIILSMMLLLYGRHSMKWYIFLFAFIGIFLQYDSPTTKAVMYAYQKIPHGAKVIIHEGKDLSYPILYKGKVLTSYYTYSFGGERIMDYIDRDRLRMFYYPVSVEGVTCATHTNKIITVPVIVLEGSPIEEADIQGENSFTVFSKLTQVRDNIYTLEIHPKGCHPVIQPLIAQELLNHGVVSGLISGDGYSY